MGNDADARSKQIVGQFWDAMAVRDWEGMKALLTEDAHYADIGSGDAGGFGPDGVVARLQMGIGDLAGYYHQPGLKMIAEGNLVMTEHTEHWVFSSGEEFDHSFVSVTELRDDRIFRWHDYSNLPNILNNAPKWWIESLRKKAAERGAA